jgi:hypothetical protein
MGRSLALSLVITLALAGCATAGADPAAAPPSPVVTATQTPAPTSTATPPPAVTATPAAPETAAPPAAAPETPAPPVAEPETLVTAVSCATILTDDEYAALAEDGLTLNPDTRAFDAEMQSLMDQGFGCYWTRGGGDVQVWYAQAEQSPDAWAALNQQLVDSGWTASNDPIEGVVSAPADHDPMYTPVIVHVDGTTYYASYAKFLNSVTAVLG